MNVGENLKPLVQIVKKDRKHAVDTQSKPAIKSVAASKSPKNEEAE